jgi:hypothetical protein
MTSPTVLNSPSESDTDLVDTRPRLQLSATQVIASALAATTATVAASYLGVAGTVIGAAVASVLTVVGNAVYSLSLRRTGQRVRTVVPVAARFVPRGAIRPPLPVAKPEPRRPRRSWAVFAAASAGVFVGVLAVVTIVELVAGRPLSDVVRGESGSGTSVLGTVGDTTTSHSTTPTPAVTVTVTPMVVTSTPTVTVTGTPVTKTATPTTTVTPSSVPSAPPSAQPSSSTPSSTAPSGAGSTSAG